MFILYKRTHRVFKFIKKNVKTIFAIRL